MGEVARKHDCKIEDQPEAIFLSPPCDEYGDGRLWCDDPQEPCDECGFPWTKYVRSDIHASALAQAEKERDGAATKLKGANEDIVAFELALHQTKDKLSAALSQLAEARGENAKLELKLMGSDNRARQQTIELRAALDELILLRESNALLDRMQTTRILKLDDADAVCVGGRFDGWRMFRHPDGQWVTAQKLEQELPSWLFPSPPPAEGEG
jgi:hypothetical protein